MVAEHVGDGVIAVSAAGQITRANTIARSLWAEIASGDLIGQRLDQLRTTLTGPTAAAQYVEIVDLPASAAERGDGYTHILLDRRDRARLARLRSELLGLLADEMRNPLTSMVTALEMTLGQNLPDGADRVLVGARRSGQRLLDLVTTMLEINQIEQNPGVLRRTPAPMSPRRAATPRSKSRMRNTTWTRPRPKPPSRLRTHVANRRPVMRTSSAWQPPRPTTTRQ